MLLISVLVGQYTIIGRRAACDPAVPAYSYVSVTRGIPVRAEEEVLTQFDNWAHGNDLVRAALLTSSRVDPERAIDCLSDYDIEMYVADLRPFQQNDDWLHAFGPVMVRWPYKPRSTFDEKWITRLVLFKDGVRIDFQITDKTRIEPDTYNNGYRVLIDKNSLTFELISFTGGLTAPGIATGTSNGIGRRRHKAGKGDRANGAR